MSFNSDLAFGNIYEKKLVELIPNESYLIKEGYFPDYDVEITNNNIMVTYEVKADRDGFASLNLFEGNERSNDIYNNWYITFKYINTNSRSKSITLYRWCSIYW